MKLLQIKYSLSMAICAIAMVTSVRSLAQNCDRPDLPNDYGNFSFLVTDSGKKFCLARSVSGDIVEPAAKPVLHNKVWLDESFASRCRWSFKRAGSKSGWHVLNSGLAWTADVSNLRVTLRPLATRVVDTQSWHWIRGPYGVGLAVSVNGTLYYLCDQKGHVCLSKASNFGWCTERIDLNVGGEQ